MKTFAAWIVLVAAASVAAAGCGNSVAGGSNPGTSDGSSALEGYQEAIGSASITLPEAIDIVAAAYPDALVYSGGLVLDSEAQDGEENDNEAGASVGATYEIEIFDGTQDIEVDVHPGTGVIESADPQNDDDHEEGADDGGDGEGDHEDDDGEADGQQDGLCEGSISLNAAITAAETETGGTAVEVESNADDCELDVKVVTADSLLEVTVSKDGSIVEVEEADDDSDGESGHQDEDGNEDEDGQDGEKEG